MWDGVRTTVSIIVRYRGVMVSAFSPSFWGVGWLVRSDGVTGEDGSWVLAGGEDRAWGGAACPDFLSSCVSASNLPIELNA